MNSWSTSEKIIPFLTKAAGYFLFNLVALRAVKKNPRAVRQDLARSAPDICPAPHLESGDPNPSESACEAPGDAASGSLVLHSTILGEIALELVHEIRNPLTVISTRSAQILNYLDRLTALDSPTDLKVVVDSLSPNVGTIIRMAEKIEELIKYLSAYSKAEVVIKKDLCDVSEIIDDALFVCQDRTLSLDVQIQLVSSPPLKVNGDFNLLSRVFVNLLSNFLDALELKGDSGGRWIRIEIKKGADLGLVTMSNNGAPIHRDLVDKLMTPFFSTKKEGFGIGLTIVKRILERHGGDISLDTNAPFTTFVVSLPMATF